MDSFARIAVVGLGYIGLPTAAVFAENGVEVLGIDVNAARGRDHQCRPAAFRRAEPGCAGPPRGGRPASCAPRLEIEPAEAFIIAVPTPLRGHGAKATPDISYVEAGGAIRSHPCWRPGNLVILESTSPVGTTERMAAILAELRPDLTFPQQRGEMADIQVAHCPERVLPGRILEEVVNNARVIGGMTRKCAQRALGLYRWWCAANAGLPMHARPNWRS